MRPAGRWHSLLPYFAVLDHPVSPAGVALAAFQLLVLPPGQYRKWNRRIGVGISDFAPRTDFQMISFSANSGVRS